MVAFATQESLKLRPDPRPADQLRGMLAIPGMAFVAEQESGERWQDGWKIDEHAELAEERDEPACRCGCAA